MKELIQQLMVQVREREIDVHKATEIISKAIPKTTDMYNNATQSTYYDFDKFVTEHIEQKLKQ